VLSGKRVFTELRLIMEEKNSASAIMRLNDFDLLKVIHPSITLDKIFTALLKSVKEVLSWHDLLFLDESYKKWIVFFLVVINQCNAKRAQEICRRFELAPEYEKIFCVERFEADRCGSWLERNQAVSNSVLYRKLSGFRTELILYMMAAARKQTVKKSISHFFTNLRRTSISLKGSDLKKMKLTPGPVYRQVLSAVLDAKLDGKLKTKEDEIKFAHHYIKIHRYT
jgi:tRNA nucleotidyltransferase (CCA-adding enzyme)